MNEKHIFPWWMGYFLISPLRKWRDNPETMLGPYLRPGMRALDAGCAMGFFSLPMARMCGERGKVICVDLQPKMLRSLERRAGRAGLASRIETRVCTPESLEISDLHGQVDFALAYAVLHEAFNPRQFLREIHRALGQNGLLFFGEPSGPVRPSEFEEELALIAGAGFVRIPSRHPAGHQCAVFAKESARTKVSRTRSQPSVSLSRALPPVPASGGGMSA
jgi:ubiquinone/menaquinone biosynthesis C-methylase UbiE